MTRLKKIASIEELGEMNMPLDLLNQVLYSNEGEDITVENVLYRRLMNQNTKFAVEMWNMSDNTFGVFSGNFDGMWTVDNIEYNGNFSSESEAESYIQTNLQGQAETVETVMVQSSRLKKNDFIRKFAAGNEPDYKEIANGFSKQVSIPEVELAHESSLNKYYDEWTEYMEQYYPEWAKYPAFIWRGWGYFVDNFGKEEEKENKEEPKDEPVQNEQVEEKGNVEVQEQEVQENVEQPIAPVDMGMGDSSNN